MKKDILNEIANDLNKALWSSFTGKDVIIEQHCEEVLLLMNKLTDMDVSVTMDAYRGMEVFKGKDAMLLNMLSANIGNIFYLCAEVNKAVEIQDYETADFMKGMVEDSINDNLKFGKENPLGISFFYAKRGEIHLKSTSWFILENMIMHKTGMLLDMSINPPNFLK